MPYPTYSNSMMPYNTYGFNPYPNQAQQMQKITNCEWIFVNGIQQVKDHIVQPNQTFYFLDNNDPVLYQKKADNLGSSQIRAYKMIEIDLNQAENALTPETNVTKDEINALAARISQLEQQMQVKEAVTNESIESISKQSDYAVNYNTEKYKSSGNGTEYTY